MEKIEWSDNYSVGVKKLDDQHFKLVEIFNKLIDERDLSVYSEVLHDSIYELMKYVEEHLKYEESLLRNYQYPDLENHVKGHEAFIEKLSNLALSATFKENSVPQTLLAFLGNWLNRHILIEDKKYQIFLKNRF